MIGYQFPLHHGWKIRHIQYLTGRQGEMPESPYPRGSSADQEFWLGSNRRSYGETMYGEKMS